MRQLLLAVNFMHQKDIVHRDLKPENILLCKNGYIKLADFGAAKYKSMAKDYKSIIGTPDYLAPEILKKEPYDKSADHWACGILMYELLFGRPPFTHKDMRVIFQRISGSIPKFPEHKPVSAECKDLILKLLTKDPRKRIGNSIDCPI